MAPGVHGGDVEITFQRGERPLAAPPSPRVGHAPKEFCERAITLVLICIPTGVQSRGVYAGADHPGSTVARAFSTEQVKFYFVTANSNQVHGLMVTYRSDSGIVGRCAPTAAWSDDGDQPMGAVKLISH